MDPFVPDVTIDLPADSFQESDASISQIIGALARPISFDTRRKVYSFLSRHHADDPIVNLALPTSTSYPCYDREIDAYLKRVIRSNRSRNARAHATYLMAGNYLELSDCLLMANNLGSSPVEFVKATVPSKQFEITGHIVMESLSYWAQVGATKLRSEARRLAEVCVKEYPRCKRYNLRSNYPADPDRLETQLLGTVALEARSILERLESFSVGARLTKILGLLDGELQIESKLASQSNTVIEFWRSDCGPCTKKLQDLEDLVVNYGNFDAEIKALNIDPTSEHWRKSMAKHAPSINGSYFGDNARLIRLWGITAVPKIVVLKPDLTILAIGALTIDQIKLLS